MDTETFGNLKFGDQFNLPEDHDKAFDKLTKRRIRYVKIVGRNDHEVHTFDTEQSNAVGRQDLETSKLRLSIGILLLDDQLVLPLRHSA